MMFLSRLVIDSEKDKDGVGIATQWWLGYTTVLVHVLYTAS